MSCKRKPVQNLRELQAEKRPSATASNRSTSKFAHGCSFRCRGIPRSATTLTSACSARPQVPPTRKTEWIPQLRVETESS